MKCLTILESPWRWLKGSEVKGAQDAAKNKSRTPEYLYRIINLCTVFWNSFRQWTIFNLSGPILNVRLLYKLNLYWTYIAILMALQYVDVDIQKYQ